MFDLKQIVFKKLMHDWLDNIWHCISTAVA